MPHCSYNSPPQLARATWWRRSNVALIVDSYLHTFVSCLHARTDSDQPGLISVDGYHSVCLVVYHIIPRFIVADGQYALSARLMASDYSLILPQGVF